MAETDRPDGSNGEGQAPGLDDLEALIAPQADKLTLDDLASLVESDTAEQPKSALPEHLRVYSPERVDYQVGEIIKAVDSTTHSYEHLNRNYEFRQKHGQNNERIATAIAEMTENDKTSTPLLRSRVIYDKIGGFARHVAEGDKMAHNWNKHLGELTPDEKIALDERARESGADGLYKVGTEYIKPEKYNHAGVTALLLSGRLEQETPNLAKLLNTLPPDTAVEYKQVLGSAIQIQKNGGTVKFPWDQASLSSSVYDMAPGGKVTGARIEGRVLQATPDQSKIDTSAKLVMQTLSPKP